VLSPYLLYILNTIGILAIAAVGLNILVGYTGQISLGHGAFFGVGAYAAAILATRLGVPFYVSIPAAGIITALVGMIFGIPSGRLKGLYLTIATLAGQIIIEYVLIQWESLTKGTMGITLPAPQIGNWTIAGDRAFFFFIFVCLVMTTWFAVNIMRSKYGRAFIAIRDNDRAAEGMGIPIFKYKLLSFAISSFYAGFAGASGRTTWSASRRNLLIWGFPWNSSPWSSSAAWAIFPALFSAQPSLPFSTRPCGMRPER